MAKTAKGGKKPKKSPEERPAEDLPDEDLLDEDLIDEEMLDLDSDDPDLEPPEEFDPTAILTAPISQIGAGAPEMIAGNALVHLGAFLWDIGILMQQGQALPPPRQGLPRKEVKAALIDDITDQINEIMNDNSLSFDEKNTARNKLTSARRNIRVCSNRNHAIGHGHLNRARRDPDLSGHRRGLDFLRLWSYLIMVKNTWKWGNPRFEFDRRSRTVKLFRHGREIMAFPVTQGRQDQARRVVRDLNNTLNACFYPDRELAKRLEALGE